MGLILTEIELLRHALEGRADFCIELGTFRHLEVLVLLGGALLLAFALLFLGTLFAFCLTFSTGFASLTVAAFLRLGLLLTLVAFGRRQQSAGIRVGLLCGRSGRSALTAGRSLFSRFHSLRPALTCKHSHPPT